MPRPTFSISRALRPGLLCGAVLAAMPAMACYSVFDASGQLVHRAAQPPSSAFEAIAVPPGGRVAIHGAGCSGPASRGSEPTAAAAGLIESRTEQAMQGSPLLTSHAAAVAAGARHAVLAPGIVAVPQGQAEQVWAQAPLHVAPPAVAEQVFREPVRNGLVDVVITEWADGRTDVERRPRR